MTDMAPPKKHKKRPANVKAKRKAGWAVTVGLTLDDDSLLEADAIAAYYGLKGRSAAVRFALKELSKKIIRKALTDEKQ